MWVLGRALLVATIYLASARYSIALDDLEGPGAVFWPGAGVTLTGLLVSPRRAWPAILAAVALAEFGNDLSRGFDLVASLWWAVANVAETLAAAWLIQRWRAGGFGDVRAVARFVGAVGVAPILGGVIGAIGAIGTAVGGVSDLPYAATATQWAIGDALGMLTVVPFGLLMLRRLPAVRLWSVAGVVALVTVGVLSLVVFGTDDSNGPIAPGYLVLLPLLWVAVRLHVAGAAVALFVMAQIANAANSVGRGPFAVTDLSPVTGSVQLQLFLVTAGITVLLLACRTVESETYQDLADARTQLIAAVSHELRTPLTSILGFSELLLQHPELDTRTRQGLEVIHRNGRHLDSLVEDLLRASRGRRGALPVHPETVTVATIVDEQLSGRTGASVEVDVDPPDARVWVDRTHLTQILTNLLDNAARHGRAPIAIRVRSDAEVTELVVADNGEGIPEWFVPHLFDEFSQAVHGDRRPTLGLGLGLPIARTLAIANGGDLSHERRDGETRFVLRLPAVAPVGAPGDQAG